MRTHEKVIKIRAIEETQKLKNHIAILPDNAKIKDAVNEYISKFGFYIE